MGVSYLADVADALLAAALAGLAEATTGRPPPATSYLSHGEPVPDHCGEVTVHLESVGHEPERFTSQGVSGGGFQSCQVVASPRFVISIFRCATNLGDGTNPLPSGDALDSDAADLLDDLWAVLTELYDRMAACTLVPGQSDCEDVSIEVAVPIEQQGDVAGWAIPVVVTANDQGPAGS